jgi:hypothetical protein
MNKRCNMKMRGRFVTLVCTLLTPIVMGICYRSMAYGSCDVTSSGSGSVGRVTKFNPSSCNIENSAIFESGGKVGIGTIAPTTTLDIHGSSVIRGATGIGVPASGGFEFQVTAPNQVGLLVEGPASGVGAGLDFKTTGTGGLQWEILDTGAGAVQGPDKLNIRNVNTAADVVTIAADGNVGIGQTNPTHALDVNANSAFPALQANNNAASGTLPEAIFGTNNSAAPTLEVINNNTSGALASFQSANGSGCFIDSGANLTCTGSITGGVAWYGGKRRLSSPGKAIGVSAAEPRSGTAPQMADAAGEWFEDYGSGRLKNGVATVALNSTFAEAIKGKDYHVFFTPYGDCKGLYVADKRKNGFEVREVGGGHSAVEFDYRVVGKHPGFKRPIRMSANSDFAKLAVANWPPS